MGQLNFNSSKVKSLTFNGQEVTCIKINGTEVRRYDDKILFPVPTWPFIGTFNLVITYAGKELRNFTLNNLQTEYLTDTFPTNSGPGTATEKSAYFGYFPSEADVTIKATLVTGAGTWNTSLNNKENSGVLFKVTNSNKTLELTGSVKDIVNLNFNPTFGATGITPTYSASNVSLWKTSGQDIILTVYKFKMTIGYEHNIIRAEVKRRHGYCPSSLNYVYTKDLTASGTSVTTSGTYSVTLFAGQEVYSFAADRIFCGAYYSDRYSKIFNVFYLSERI